MVEKLHERAPQQLADAAAREDEVVEGHEGKEEDEADAGQELHDAVPLPPSRQTLVPDGRQQLLAMRVSHELEQLSITQPINQSINQSINQPIKSINQVKINQFINQPNQRHSVNQTKSD